MFTAIGHKAT
jgi:RNA-directed DNA polymerase